MSDEVFIGIEIGGTKLQLVTRDASGCITTPVRLAVDRARGGEGIREAIEARLKNLVSGSAKIAAVGVGFGGPVDWRSGRTCRSHQIDGWEDFPLRDWLAKVAGAAAVAVENDAN